MYIKVPSLHSICRITELKGAEKYSPSELKFKVRVMIMVFSSIFNNISVISW